MHRLLTLCATLTLPLAACSKKDKGSDSPEEQSERDPLEELQSIPGQIQAEVDAVLQPINDVDVVVDQMSSLPSKYDVDAPTLAGMAKMSLEGGTVSVDIDVSADAKAEIETLLQTVRGIGTGLKEIPQRASVATKNIVGLGAKAAALVTKLQSKYQAKLSNPLLKAEQKASIEAELTLTLKLQGDIKAVVGDAKQTVMGVPAMGTEARGKLTAALAGASSASSGDDEGPDDAAGTPAAG